MNTHWLMSLAGRCGAAVREALFPTGVECLHCGEPARGEVLCASCRAALAAEELDTPLCPACGEELADGLCRRCAPESWRLFAAYRYRGMAREVVHHLKYDGYAPAAALLAERMAAVLPECGGWTVVTWVTMPRGRRRRRGIDHGRVLAQAVAGALQLPTRELLIRSGGARRTQRGLTREERLRNLRGCFAAHDAAGEHILLVDDVMTTGATASACAEALFSAGAASVTVLTAAETEKKRA